ncbi:MAG TPA: ROK family protein [Chthoniobacterales bacterium]|nr:ROK family protein [Chthoniobacterales bacterium]
MKTRVLVIDVGGSHVKLMISNRVKRRKFSSGKSLTPRKFISETKKLVADWKFDVIAIGFPAPVKNGRIALEPKNLGKGWRRVNFRRAFGKPVRVMNDAAMQALGSYHGKRMLFLGFGTGLGSALLWNRTVLSLELGDLPYVHNQSLEDRFGDSGLERLGRKHWTTEVLRIVPEMKKAFVADYVVLGGGNAKCINKPPRGVELGNNRNAFTGGVRLWNKGRSAWTII